MMNTRNLHRVRDEQGASLVLAIIFVFAVGLALVAIGGLATNALRNTSNLQQLRTSEGGAEAATTIAMRYVQTTYTAYGATATPCLPPSIPGPPQSVDSTQVLCTQTASSIPGYSRIVDFYACPSSASVPACTTAPMPALVLHAKVAYSDSNFAGTNNCSSTVQATCGAGVSLQSWDVIRADS